MERSTKALQADLLATRAENLFKEGYNCCESVIKASIEIMELHLPEDTYLIGKYFRQGLVGSGCICGALAGGIMLLGYITGPDNKDTKKAEKFRAQFIERFGSTCCRIIRKKQNIIGRINNKECQEITRFSAGLLSDIINSEGLTNG